jgi:hypothetical protein
VKKTLLDGNHGSNLLGAIAVALVAGHVEWSRVFSGKLSEPETFAETAKVIAITLLATYAYYVGRPTQ